MEMVTLTGSSTHPAVVTSASANYVSQSVLAFNFNDMYNQASKKINATSINFNAKMKRRDFTQKNGGYKFDIKNGTRFFERSRFSNNVEAYGITPSTKSAIEGTHITFDGKTPSDTIATPIASESRAVKKNHSMMVIDHSRHLDFRRDDNYSITMRVSASQDQPSKDSIDNGGPHTYILSKLDNIRRASFPFSMRLANNNSNGTTQGKRGGIQVAVSDGVFETTVNSTGSITGSNEFYDITFVKSESTIRLYVNAELQDTSLLTGSREIYNKGKIVVGATTAWKGRYEKVNPSSSYARKTRPQLEYYRNFKGGISNMMFFNRNLLPAEIAYGYATRGNFTNLVGNVFYNHGIITLTSIDGRYDNS